MMVRFEDVFRSCRPLLRSAYPALVTGLAAGLLVLLLWPQPPRRFAAEAIVAASGGGNLAADSKHVLAWLKSDEVLRAVAANLDTSEPRELAALTESAAGDPLEAIRAPLRLVSLASPDEMPRLAVGIEGPRRRGALALADELARQLSDHYSAQAKRDRLARLQQREQQADAELQQARGLEERLQVELQGLQHAHLASAVASTAAKPGPVPITGAANRQPSELERTLESLKLERDRLLEIYLPAHPQIQSLTAQISRLEESLRRMSREPDLRGGDRSALEADRGASVLLDWRRDLTSQEVQASGQGPLVPSADPRSELAAAIRQTQLDLLAATHRRQKADDACQALAAERKQLDSTGDVTWRRQPAQITSASGGASTRGQLAAALAVALLAGLSTGWLAANDQRLTSAAELRSSVALPVLATLDGGDSEPLATAKPPPGQAAAQLAARCGEVVLATFVLTLLAAIALDHRLLSDLSGDPLGTLGELLERLV